MVLVGTVRNLPSRVWVRKNHPHDGWVLVWWVSPQIDVSRRDVKHHGVWQLGRSGRGNETWTKEMLSSIYTCSEKRVSSRARPTGVGVGSGYSCHDNDNRRYTNILLSRVVKVQRGSIRQPRGPCTDRRCSPQRKPHIILKHKLAGAVVVGCKLTISHRQPEKVSRTSVTRRDPPVDKRRLRVGTARRSRDGANGKLQG